VRAPEGSGQPLVVVGKQTTVQVLEPDALEALYTFHLEVLRRGARELTCECDPSLRPFEVSVPNLDKWELQDPTNPGAPALLRLWPREPRHEGELEAHRLRPPDKPG